jgi:hypothetical protein
MHCIMTVRNIHYQELFRFINQIIYPLPENFKIIEYKIVLQLSDILDQAQILCEPVK